MRGICSIPAFQISWDVRDFRPQLAMKERGVSIMLPLLIAFATICGCRGGNDNGSATLWLNSGATTPALPVYAAQREHPELKLEIRTCDSPVLLNSILLSGQGQYWLASVETLARAYDHGAPIQLLAVTGWRKFHLLSSRGNDTLPQDFAGRTLPYAPPGSPGRDVLENLLRQQDAPQPTWLPQESRQLMLKLLDGQFDCALLPEPFATILETKAPQFHRVVAVEDYMAQTQGGDARLPWAAIAVNRDWAAKHQDEVRAFLSAMVTSASRLSELTAEQAVEYLPPQQGIPYEMMVRSLLNDLICVVPASDIPTEIQSFLKLAAPETKWDETLLWNQFQP